MVQLPHDTKTPDVQTASAEYANRFCGPVGEWLLSVQEQGVHTLLKNYGRDVRSVLEVGGGHAQLTDLFLSTGREVTVHGSAVTCFERLRRREGPHAPGPRFAVANLWHLPFPDRTFDLVAGVRLLAHVDRWRELLTEMVRVARRYILIDFPPLSSPNLLTPALFWAKRRVEGDTRPYFCYWERTIRSHLKTCGAARVWRYRQLALPMGVHRAIGWVLVSAAAEGALRALTITRWVGSPTLLLAERADGPNDHRENGSG